MPRSYEELLSRARSGLDKDAKKSGALRLELPDPDVIWVGNKTIFHNYSEFPKRLQRDPGRVLMYLAKELATAASLDGERPATTGSLWVRTLPQPRFGVQIPLSFVAVYAKWVIRTIFRIFCCLSGEYVYN